MNAVLPARPAPRFRSIRSAAALYVGPLSIGEPPSPRVVATARKHYISHMRSSSAGRLVAFALLLGWLASTAVHAEIISVPSADPPDPASLAPPTVLRGSPPATVKPVPICPPGY